MNPDHSATYCLLTLMCRVGTGHVTTLIFLHSDILQKKCADYVLYLCLSQGSIIRRPFPQSGDKCHSCDKSVYLVERVCAEGLFFHRECFQCSTCNSTLRQGAHAFDSEQGITQSFISDAEVKATLTYCKRSEYTPNKGNNSYTGARTHGIVAFYYVS